MKKLSVPMARYELILGWIYLVVLMSLLQVAIGIVYGVIVTLTNTPMSLSLLQFICFAANFICVIAIFWKFLWGNLKTFFSRVWKNLLIMLGAFALYWVLNIIISFFILWVFPDFTNVNDDAISEMVEENALLMIIGTVALVPLAEEVLFRGLIFRGLYNRSRVAAYLVSIAVFAAMHVVNYIGNGFQWYHLLLCFLQYVPAGLCLGWAYAKADSIIAPVLIHTTINAIGMLAMR